MLQYLQRYRRSIESLDLSTPLHSFPESLLIRRDGPWASYYAPFEHLNRGARIALVGLTPGLQQAENALHALQTALRRGVEDSRALEIAKNTASFSGPMRTKLVALLDTIGLHTQLGLSSTSELFGSHANLVHYTSAFRFPVALHGKNYGGGKRLAHHPFLREELATGFSQELRELPADLVFFPLGSGATEALEWLVRERLVPPERVFAGLPHPSPANVERVDYFTGRKARESCSNKVDTALIDRRRAELTQRVASLKWSRIRAA
jgi:hypothetical protein